MAGFLRAVVPFPPSSPLVGPSSAPLFRPFSFLSWPPRKKEEKKCKGKKKASQAELDQIRVVDRAL